MDTVNRVLFQYPIRRLIVGTRKVSKLRDLYIELFDRSGNCQAPRQHCCRCACQISKRCDDLNYQSCGFDTSCDFTMRRLMRYWYVALVPSHPTCTVYWGVLKVTWYLLMQYFSKTSVQLWPPVIIFSGLVSCDIGLVYACAFRKAAGRICLNMQSIREGREVHLQFRSTKRSLSKYASNIWVFPGNQNLLQANILLFNDLFGLREKKRERKNRRSYYGSLWGQFLTQRAANAENISKIWLHLDHTYIPTVSRIKPHFGTFWWQRWIDEALSWTTSNGSWCIGIKG